jgi:putative FmdB family regulatory protein
VPIYEYQCKECGHRFERLQAFNAQAPDCPECGGEVEQLMSAPAVQFKGSGWYVTDYARKSPAPAGEKKPTESKSESKSESGGAKKD